MSANVTVVMSLRQALALLAVSLEHGISRHSSRPELAQAEIELARAIADASKANQDDRQATRSQDNDYQAQDCL